MKNNINMKPMQSLNSKTNSSISRILDYFNMLSLCFLIEFPVFIKTKNVDYNIFKTVLVHTNYNLEYLEAFKKNLNTLLENQKITLHSHNLKIVENIDKNSSIIENNFVFQTRYLDFYRLIIKLKEVNFLGHIDSFTINKINSTNQLKINLNTTLWIKS